MEGALDDEAISFEEFPGASRIFRTDTDAYHQYKDLGGCEENPYHPFANEME